VTAIPTPTHHLPAETLLEYVTGSAKPVTALLAAAHLTLCPWCREEARRLEDIGGALLQSLPAAESSSMEAALGAVMAQLHDEAPREGVHEGAEPGEAPGTVAPANDLSSVPSRTRSESRASGPSVRGAQMPRPVLEALGHPTHIPWRWLAPGVRGVTLAGNRDEGAARLVDLRANLEIPFHDHAGPEYVLVLEGVLLEDGTRFARGDVATAGPGLQHVQRTDPAGPCLALVVNEGELVPLNLRGKLLKLLSGF
jgi:putative transcriptional regulator